jgi:hypothetical protein
MNRALAPSLLVASSILAGHVEYVRAGSPELPSPEAVQTALGDAAGACTVAAAALDGRASPEEVARLGEAQKHRGLR